MRSDFDQICTLSTKYSWTDTSIIPSDIWDYKEEQSNLFLQVILDFSYRLARLVADDPRGLDSLHWRDVERMLAAVFKSLGFDVELGPGSKDGGKDIVLKCVIRGLNKRYLIEVKHWRSGKRVGQAEVEKFINVIAQEVSDGGLFVATYGYNSQAFEVLTKVNQDTIRLESEGKIVTLCKTFVRAEQGLWKPSNNLSEVLFGDPTPR